MDLLNINIASNHFPKYAASCFTELFEDNMLADVTLVCSDDQQIKAHKVILGSSSPVFKNIFQTTNLAQPIIYMKGVKYSELKSIIRFIYLGQAEIQQISLDDFLSIARDLMVKGLSQYFDGQHHGNSFTYKDSDDSNNVEDNPIPEKGLIEGDDNNMQEEENIEQLVDKKVNLCEDDEKLENKLISKESIKQKLKSDLSIRDYYALAGRDFYDLKVGDDGLFSCSDCSYSSKSRTNTLI